jgi:transposase
LTQTLPDWIGSHIRCFKFLGGAPRLVVPDNLKSGVTSPSRYEPDINPTYLKLATHYGVAVVPARVRKPRDKSKVENAVLQVERNILARLRDHTFHSLAEMNEAIAQLLRLHNDRYSKSLESSRTDIFLSVDQPALHPLPEHAFADGEWAKATVNIDYHVVVDHHRYSVPNTLIGKVVEIHLTTATVEIFVGNERVASHRRSHVRHAFTTVAEHMPQLHRQAGWQQDEFLAKACKHGPNTQHLIRTILASRPVPEQTYRSCLGVLRLADKYGSERMEAAALRAVVMQTANYISVQVILKKDQDKLPLLIDQPDAAPIIHENIRGEVYFGEKAEEEADNA